MLFNSIRNSFGGAIEFNNGEGLGCAGGSVRDGNMSASLEG
jgi:hypothetical protein